MGSSSFQSSPNYTDTVLSNKDSMGNQTSLHLRYYPPAQTTVILALTHLTSALCNFTIFISILVASPSMNAHRTNRKAISRKRDVADTSERIAWSKKGTKRWFGQDPLNANTTHPSSYH
ncbi:hypothetical protein VTL71DRAFT_7106 [Oculimacula yallundae]|uniref:Uncharacterized protein n=1 Tax=Oculimacula yallundae TaxID=86028 RepID=A0ABR4BVS8_9HELO